MRFVVLTLALTSAIHTGLAILVAQSHRPVPAAFEEMAEAERAFVRRAQEVSVLQAFTEYFADDAVSFQAGRPASAQAEMRERPIGPRDPNVLFWWEPRYGDIAASGELGWLTGPVRSARQDRDGGKVRHGNYASIWKRQADGGFKVVIDIGLDPPGEVPFAPGLVRAPVESRFTGADIAPLAQASLLAADRALNAAARTSPKEAYAAASTASVRLHRAGEMPIEGRDAAVRWFTARPPLAAAESLYAEAARSADLGYTWGSYEGATTGTDVARRGHYARVWVRDAGGGWKLALDLDAPAPTAK